MRSMSMFLLKKVSKDIEINTILRLFYNKLKSKQL